MSAQASSPSPAQEANALFDNTLTPAQTRYLLDSADLQQFLREKFPDMKDFKISTKNGRWKFRAPEVVSESTVRSWTARVQARIDGEKKARKEKAKKEKAAKSDGAGEGTSSGATGA